MTHSICGPCLHLISINTEETKCNWLLGTDLRRSDLYFVQRRSKLNVCFDAGTSKANWVLPGLSSHIYANFSRAKGNTCQNIRFTTASFISFTCSSFFILPCLDQAWYLMELCHDAICTGCSISQCHAINWSYQPCHDTTGQCYYHAMTPGRS